MRVYVGNFPWKVTEDELNELFSQYGTVSNLGIIMDRETNRSKGFAFLEMERDEAQEAIDALNGFSWGGRKLTVNEARPREY